MPPSLAHGKICYLIIPAKDLKTSSGFYENVFGWNIRRRENGEVSFDDGVGEVSGMWVEGEKPVDAGFVHIMVDDAERTCKLIPQSGGVTMAGKYALVLSGDAFNCLSCRDRGRRD